MSYGKIVSKLRKNKNYSLENACRNTMTKSFLSKYEREKVNISVTKFFKLLDNLNVEYDEIDYIKNGYRLSSKRRVEERIIMAFQKIDLEELEKLNRELIQELETTEDIFFLHNHLLVYSLICRVKNEKIDEEKVLPIKYYLFNTQYWGYYELRLFTNMMFIYDLETLEFLIEKALKEVYLYRDLNANQDDLARMLINRVLCCFDQHNNRKAQKYLKTIESIGVKETAFFEKVTIEFLNGILLIKNGHKTSGEEKCLFSLEVFKRLGMKEYASYYKNYLEQV